MKKSEIKKMIIEELEALNEKRFPPKAMDYNKIDNADGFWNWSIKDAKYWGGLRGLDAQTDIGGVILWLNMAAGAWERKNKK